MNETRTESYAVNGGLFQGLLITSRLSSPPVHVGNVLFQCSKPFSCRIKFVGELVDEFSKPPEYISSENPKEDYYAPWSGGFEPAHALTRQPLPPGTRTLIGQ